MTGRLHSNQKIFFPSKLRRQKTADRRTHTSAHIVFLLRSAVSADVNRTRRVITQVKTGFFSPIFFSLFSTVLFSTHTRTYTRTHKPRVRTWRIEFFAQHAHRVRFGSFYLVSLTRIRSLFFSRPRVPGISSAAINRTNRDDGGARSRLFRRRICATAVRTTVAAAATTRAFFLYSTTQYQPLSDNTTVTALDATTNVYHTFFPRIRSLFVRLDYSRHRRHCHYHCPPIGWYFR